MATRTPAAADSTQPMSPEPGLGRDDGSLRSPLGKSATTMLVLLVVLWVVDIANAAVDRRWNVEFGIIGRDPGHLIGIIVSPFLHANAPHLVANASALFTLGLLAGLHGIWRFFAVVGIVILLGGIVDWIFAPSDAASVGASGVVFGLLGYLVSRGLTERRPVDIVVSLGVAVAFGYHIFTGLFPDDERIAWLAHLTGFLAGMVAAWVLRRRKKKPSVPTAEQPAGPAPVAEAGSTPSDPVVAPGPDAS